MLNEPINKEMVHPAWRLRLACMETTPCLHAIKAKLYASQNQSYNILIINR